MFLFTAPSVGQILQAMHNKQAVRASHPSPLLLVCTRSSDVLVQIYAHKPLTSTAQCRRIANLWQIKLLNAGERDPFLLSLYLTLSLSLCRQQLSAFS